MCVKTWVWGNSVCHIFLCWERSSLLRSEALFFTLIALALHSSSTARVVRPQVGAGHAQISHFILILCWRGVPKILYDWWRCENIWSWSKSPFYSVYGDVMMILIVEYTLALYSKNTEQMIISNPLLFFNVQKVILYIFFLFHLLANIFFCFQIWQNFFCSSNL